jgi:putative DNA primase/helicase
MTTARTQKQPDLAYAFWRLYHSLLRNGQSDTKASFGWLEKNARAVIRAAGQDDVRRDLVVALWQCAEPIKDLPSYDLVFEHVCRMPRNVELLDALKVDYPGETKMMKVYEATDLPKLFVGLRNDWETLNFYKIQRTAASINFGTIELPEFMGKRNVQLSGPHDASLYLAHMLGKGTRFSETDDFDALFSADQTTELVSGMDGTEQFTVTAVNAATVTPKPISWLWPERYPLGKLALNAGKPDCGKSLVTLDLAARVTTGSDWPDGSKNTLGPRSVLMAVAEDDLEDTVVPRLKAAGADLTKIHFIDKVKTQDFAAERDEDMGPHTRALQLAADVNKLKKAIEANPDFVLVIVDTITSFFGDINTNADKDVRPVMDALTEAFRDCQATFLAIVHHNKKNDADAIQKILGASSLPGSVRVAYSFSRNPDDKSEFFMARAKGNLTKNHGGMKYVIDEKEVAPGITAPYIKWMEEIEESANEIAERDRDVDGRRELKQIDKARLFLPVAMEKGPRLARELYKEAAAEGITEKTLKTVRYEMNLRTIQRSDGWYWFRDNEAADQTMTVMSEEVM